MFLDFLSCKAALSRLDDYIDRRLTPREQLLVTRHLKICHQCSQKFAFETELVEGLRARLSHIEAPPALLEQIRASLASAPSNAPSTAPFPENGSQSEAEN